MCSFWNTNSLHIHSWQIALLCHVYVFLCGKYGWCRADYFVLIASTKRCAKYDVSTFTLFNF